MEVYPEPDRSKQYLGRLCLRNHDWHSTGQSWRWLNDRSCVECTYARLRRKRPAKHPFRFPRLPNTATIADRFWSKIEKTDSCWLWRGATGKRGYGCLRRDDGTVVPAHRLSYELCYGSIPDGLWVLHRCDVRACVRPDHLFLGTVLDNNRDMFVKGRARPGPLGRGEDNNKAKLTKAKVRDIRRLHEAGISYTELGRRYGISRQAASRVVTRQTWKHVP